MDVVDIASLPDEFYCWFYEHRTDDVARLRLKWSGREPWIEFAILQVECRRRVGRRLSDETAYDRFLFPTALSAQQATSDALARFHATLVPDGCRLLDMTCGLGIDAIHLARCVSSVTAVDVDAIKTDVLNHNAAVMGIDNINVRTADCRDVLAETVDGGYDVVFVDPARRDDDGKRLFSIADCQPDVLSMLPEIERVSRRMVVKLSPMLDVTQTLRELPSATDIYVLGAVNECKELTVVCDFDASISTPDVRVHVVSPDSAWPPFAFTMAEEATSVCGIAPGPPQPGQLLYEPSAPAMKAAPWGVLSSRFSMAKLHANTHLYISDNRYDDFPGTVWHIDEVLPFASGVLKRFSRRWPSINVAVRNFGMSADQLRRRLGVRDTPDDATKVIGVTCGDSRYLLVLSKNG